MKAHDIPVLITLKLVIAVVQISTQWNLDGLLSLWIKLFKGYLVSRFRNTNIVVAFHALSSTVNNIDAGSGAHRVIDHMTVLVVRTNIQWPMIVKIKL